MAHAQAVEQRKTGTVQEQSLFDGIGKKMPNLEKLLPRDIEIDQFRAATWLHIQEMWDGGLRSCLPESVVTCVVKAATYGLMPGRDCHFLPFQDKRRGGKVATYVPNYFGIIRALERTGKVAKAFAHPVYEGDTCVIDYLADTFSHVPAAVSGKEQGKLKLFYGCILMKDGTRHIQVMTLEDINKVKQRAPGHENGPWVTDFIAMAKKTCIKQAAKPVQLTPALHQMMEEDDARTLTDIPAQRFQKTKNDLWGSHGVDEDVIDLETGEIQEEDPIGQPPTIRDRLKDKVQQATAILRQAERSLKAGDEMAPHIRELQGTVTNVVPKLDQMTEGETTDWLYRFEDLLSKQAQLTL